MNTQMTKSHKEFEIKGTIAASEINEGHELSLYFRRKGFSSVLPISENAAKTLAKDIYKVIAARHDMCVNCVMDQHDNCEKTFKLGWIEYPIEKECSCHHEQN